MKPIDYIYDLETYPGIFTASFKRVEDGTRWLFEISVRRNDAQQLVNFIEAVANTNGRLVGFNNIGFDYPVLHVLLTSPVPTAVTSMMLYEKAMAIITGNNNFAHMVWESDWAVPQLDLYKIHHFDNRARSTSLKVLEFNMRSANIEDLPFEPGTHLTHEQMDVLIKYNDHDVDQTELFYHESKDAIALREELSVKYDRNFLNHNDTKIGKDYFIMRLEEAGVPCYVKEPGRSRQPRQTPRPQIHLRDAVFPYIQFTRPEFQRVRDWFVTQTITETKGTFKDLEATLDGFTFVFGLGGIHGSVSAQTVASDEDHIVRDADVASYYPNLAIANRVYPEHLSETFCDIYQDVYNQRSQFEKGTPENAMFKLALNGVYGDSNNQYSPFYDPLYTMKITINGQLLLCMLAEHLMNIPGLQMVSINTDGLTVRMPRSAEPMYDYVCQWWQEFTCLQLEYADYSRVFARDVNNYLAEGVDGKLKHKGAYCYGDDLNWSQNHSSQVVTKAAEAALVRGEDIATFIHGHTDLMDFMLRAKVPRSSRLVLTNTEAWGDTDFPLQNTTRYYVTQTGGSLVKVMPPTPSQVAKNPDAPERRIGICVGWKVTECNDITQATVPINYDYYIQEAKKLVEPLR